jgi:hypothetical protein
MKDARESDDMPSMKGVFYWPDAIRHIAMPSRIGKDTEYRYELLENA